MSADKQTQKNVISVGLGTMGPGVAVDYLLGGHKVTIMGRSEAKLSIALEQAVGILKFLQDENFLSEQRHQEAQANLTTALLQDSKALLQQASIVVESISEDIQVKKDFFAGLEMICPPTTIFLTNTSGLSISAIFSDLKQPQRAMGTHYWNPAYLMPLVELTAGENTSPQLLEQVAEMLQAMGKTPVRVGKELPGLIWNRLQFALLRESLYLLEEGAATVEEIDQVIQRGLARRSSFMGLLKVADLGGGDVWYGIASYLFKTLADNPEPPVFWQEMIDAGKLGTKTGHGFYDWKPDEAKNLIAARDRFLLAKLKEDQAGK